MRYLLLAYFLEALEEVTAKARRKKNLGPAVGSGGEEWQFAGAVGARVDRHSGRVSTRDSIEGSALQSQRPALHLRAAGVSRRKSTFLRAAAALRTAAHAVSPRQVQARVCSPAA